MDALPLGPLVVGQSVLARRLATTLPVMTLAEALEPTRLHSMAGRTTFATARERQRIAGAYREGTTGGSC